MKKTDWEHPYTIFPNPRFKPTDPDVGHWFGRTGYSETKDIAINEVKDDILLLFGTSNIAIIRFQEIRVEVIVDEYGLEKYDFRGEIETNEGVFSYHIYYEPYEAGYGDEYYIKIWKGDIVYCITTNSD